MFVINIYNDWCIVMGKDMLTYNVMRVFLLSEFRE